MSEGAFDSAEYTEAPKALPVTVLELYQEALKRRGFESDAAQYSAVLRLQRLHEEWTEYKRRRSTAAYCASSGANPRFLSASW